LELSLFFCQAAVVGRSLYDIVSHCLLDLLCFGCVVCTKTAKQETRRSNEHDDEDDDDKDEEQDDDDDNDTNNDTTNNNNNNNNHQTRRIQEVENRIHYTSLTKMAAADEKAASTRRLDDCSGNSNNDSNNSNERRNSSDDIGRRATIFNCPLDASALDNTKDDALVMDIASSPTTTTNTTTTTFKKTPEQIEFLQAVLQDNFLFSDFTKNERDLFIAALQREKVPCWERPEEEQQQQQQQQQRKDRKEQRSRSLKSVTTTTSSMQMTTSSTLAAAAAASTSSTATATSGSCAVSKDAATIIRQGDVHGDYVYIVQQGRVEFERAGQPGFVIGSCQAGGVFGELALLYDCPRAATCIAVKCKDEYNHKMKDNDDDDDDDNDGDYCHLWKMDRTTFRHLLARQACSRDQDIQQLLSNIPIFKDLDRATRTRLANALITISFKPGDRIVQKGQTGNVFYIIQQGHVQIHDIGLGDSHLQDVVLGPGDWFGERALLTGEVRAANATAIMTSSVDGDSVDDDSGGAGGAGVVTLAMDRETFESTIGPLRNLVDAEMKKHFLQAIPLFAKNSSNQGGCITEPEFQQLVKLMTNKTYEKGERLATAGEVHTVDNDCLWIIQTGQLLVTTHTHTSDISTTNSSSSSSTTLSLKSGDYFFGDEATLKEGLLSAYAAATAGSSLYNNSSSSSFQSSSTASSGHSTTKRISTLDAVVAETMTTWVLTLADIEAVLGDLNRLAGIAAATTAPPPPPPPATTTTIGTADPVPVPRCIAEKRKSGRCTYVPPSKASMKHSNTHIPLESLEKHRILGHGAIWQGLACQLQAANRRRDGHVCSTTSQRNVCAQGVEQAPVNQGATAPLRHS
jgi:cAMP-dependent protein kinase regulator